MELEIDKLLTELTLDDFDILLIHMEYERGIKKGGIKLYIVFLKKFTKWAIEDPQKWIRELKIPKVSTRIQAADILDKKEFDNI